MKSPKNLTAVVLAILLVACLFAYYSTRYPAKPTAVQKKSAAAEHLVDTSLLQAELKVAPLAATPDEQGQAHEAWRLADHELDLAFAAALREAEAEAQSEAGAALPANSPLRRLHVRIATLIERVDADKKRVKALDKDPGDVLDLAQAQLPLDQDELERFRQQLHGQLRFLDRRQQSGRHRPCIRERRAR